MESQWALLGLKGESSQSMARQLGESDSEGNPDECGMQDGQ